MLLAWAPWFNSAALEHEDVVSQYAVDGWLPGGVSLAVTETWAWRRKFACYDAYLYICNGRTLEGVRAEFAESATAGNEYFNLRLWSVSRISPRHWTS